MSAPGWRVFLVWMLAGLESYIGHLGVLDIDTQSAVSCIYRVARKNGATLLYSF